MGNAQTFVSGVKVYAAIQETDARFQYLTEKGNLGLYSTKASDFTQMWVLLATAVGSVAMKTPRISAKQVSNKLSPKQLLETTPFIIGDTGLTARFTEDDEDFGDQFGLDDKEGLAGLVLGRLFIDSQQCPLDQRQDYFPDLRTGTNTVEDVFGDIFIDLPVKWTEFESDLSFSLIAFEGLGMCYLTGMPAENHSLHPVVDGAACQIDLSFLAAFATRPPYEKYGCIAYFSLTKEPLAVYWCLENRLVMPDDSAWDHVKLVFRSSLAAAVTVKDHLLHVHLQCSNTMLFASRQSCGPDHPIRRLTKPHIYRAAKVNWGAKGTLMPAGNLAFRTFAFDEADFPVAFAACLRTLKFRTFPDEIRAKNLPKEIARNLPYKQDGEGLWTVIHSYVYDYLSVFYTDDAAVLADDDAVQYYHHYVHPAAWIDYGVPPLSKDSLVDLLTHSIFWVTGGHELVGGLVQYALCPNGLVSRIGPNNVSEGDIDSFYIALSLLGLTGKLCQSHWSYCYCFYVVFICAISYLMITISIVMKMPLLMDDWSHIHIHDHLTVEQKTKLIQVVAKFQADLATLSGSIDALNLSRRQPFEAFNPKYLESSVSV